MGNDPEIALSPAESRDLRRIAGLMIPASTEYDVPGADDAVIFADMLSTLGRDTSDVQQALALLTSEAGGPFNDLADAQAETVAFALLQRPERCVATLGRVVLQCYYRDDRVVRAFGKEPRPPYPKGHVLEQGDWSLLDPVRNRAPLWRDDRKA